MFKFHALAGAVLLGFVSQHAIAQEAVVRLGHVGPTSGSIAHLGKDNENGARLAVEELNAKGISIGGKNVSTTIEGIGTLTNPVIRKGK